MNFAKGFAEYSANRIFPMEFADLLPTTTGIFQWHNNGGSRMAGFDRLLTQIERIAEHALTQSITDPKYRVFSLVRVADVVTKQRSILKKHLYEYALMAHFDFTLTRDLVPILVIECDGDWHDQPAQQIRDRTKDEICRNLGLPLIRVDVRNMSYQQVETTFGTLLKSQAALYLEQTPRWHVAEPWLSI